MAYDLEVPVPEGVRTKRRILETALDLFGEHGYEAASLRQLAHRMDFTPAALYYHFDSKADILQAVVAPLLDDIDTVLEDHTGSERVLLERLVDILLKHRAIVGLLASDVSAARASRIRERLETQSRHLVNMIAGDDIDEEALVRVTAALGAVRRPLVDLPGVDLAAHRDLIVASALGALNPPRGQHHTQGN